MVVKNIWHSISTSHWSSDVTAPGAPQVIGCEKHANWSLEAARESMVLLQNPDSTLPFRIKGRETIAVSDGRKPLEMHTPDDRVLHRSHTKPVHQ
jgi:beta-glucosidase-like glycosyl hydrolase